MNFDKKNGDIFFAGSGSFGSLVLPYLKNKINNLEVITQKGGNIPVFLKAKELGIPVFEVPDKYELEKLVIEKKPKFIIIADFGIIFSSRTLKVPKKIINIHPSLLPKYRGPSPYTAALINQEKETGISVMDLVPEIDTGPVYIKKTVKITGKETKTSLEKKLAKTSGEIIKKHLWEILENKITPKKQNHKDATYTKMHKKNDGRINWKENAKEIEAKIRALNPWPGTFTKISTNNKKIIIKILEAEVVIIKSRKKVLIEKSRLFIKTGDGYLSIKKVQPESKKPMVIKDFLSGYKKIKLD